MVPVYIATNGVCFHRAVTSALLGMPVTFIFAFY
jgi:hypothetical protein